MRRGAGPAREGKSEKEQVKEEETDALTAASQRRGAAGVRGDENNPTRPQALQLFHGMAFGRGKTGREINQ